MSAPRGAAAVEGNRALGWLLDGRIELTRGRGGWGVVGRAEVRRAGMVGRAVERARTSRLRVGRHPPDRLLVLAGELGVAVSGDARLTRGDTCLVPVTLAGEPALLRLGPDAEAAHRAVAALRLLGDELETVPRHLGVWRGAGFVATVESTLKGGQPVRLHAGMTSQVVRDLGIAAGLVEVRHPTESSAGDALRARVTAILEACTQVPGRQTLEDLAGAAADRLDDLPAALEHGDLWHRNLLVMRNRLTGIVDWDSWRPAGVPGADVLGLVVNWERQRARLSSGGAVDARLWRTQAAALVSLGLDRGLLDAIGVAWWLGTVSGTLQRVPERASDPVWLSRAVGHATGSGHLEKP